MFENLLQIFNIIFDIHNITLTVLLRNNLTENSFGTRPERVRKCVPFAFHSRSIRVPFAFHLRSICVPLLRERNREHVPVTVLVKSAVIEYHRDFRVLISVAFTLYSITKRAIAKLSQM